MMAMENSLHYSPGVDDGVFWGPVDGERVKQTPAFLTDLRISRIFELGILMVALGLILVLLIAVVFFGPTI